MSENEMPKEILISPEALKMPITRGPHQYTTYIRADHVAALEAKLQAADKMAEAIDALQKIKDERDVLGDYDWPWLGMGLFSDLWKYLAAYEQAGEK